jgi:uncharacterized protein
MKVIITGGTGLIGRTLTQRLAKDGDEIVILSRSTDRPEGLPPEARVVKWDSQTGKGWSSELANTDVLINLAGSNLSGGRWTESRKQLIHESRVNAGNAVVDGIKSSGHVPKLLIQASGSSYYGHQERGFVDESSPPGTDFLASVCVEWEETTETVEHLGARRVIIRTGPVLNKDDGALPPIVMPFHLFLGGRTGSGRQGLSWIHLHDEVEAIRFLIEHEDIEGPVNLCAPNPVSNQQFAEAVGRVMNRPSVFPVPGIALRTLLGEISDTVLLGQYALPKRLTDAGFEFRFPDIDSALEDLIGNESKLPGSRLFRSGVAAIVRMLLP